MIRRMRINLVTPFAEKDAVKALGARWDAAQKVWYIKYVADLTPFLRWISNMEVATESSTAGTAQVKTNAPKAQSHGVTTKPTVEVPHCGCNVLPWEDCEHASNP
jgi:hypothetical protein